MMILLQNNHTKLSDSNNNIKKKHNINKIYKHIKYTIHYH